MRGASSHRGSAQFLLTSCELRVYNNKRSDSMDLVCAKSGRAFREKRLFLKLRLTRRLILIYNRTSDEGEEEERRDGVSLSHARQG